MSLRDLPRYLRTTRHLRPSQILWRLRGAAERRWTRGRVRPFPFDRAEDSLDPRPTPEVPILRRKVAGVVDDLERGEIHHLNRRVTIGREEPDWQLGLRSTDRLWTITLHYHEWAYDLARAAENGDSAAAGLFRRYLLDWIRRSRLSASGARDLAWSPYAVATRIGWWIRSFRSLERGRREADLRERLLSSLWQQAAFLRDHIEWDLAGNHLLRNAAGLAWAGRFFRGPEAKEWLTTAADLAAGQIEEQVLPDGGHFERSPMYHALVMGDVLSLAILLEDPIVTKRLKEAWSRMAEYIAWVRHPDGGIPLLNDASDRAAPRPSALLDLGERMGSPVDRPDRSGGRHFPDTGLLVWHGNPWSLFFDVGEIGPDVQPGHAHADTLTFECSFEGERIVVDPGTFGYDRDERRRYDRSTDAHNTVCLDGEDSSEVWHIFRVGRRARTLPAHVEMSSDGATAIGGHDGYFFLPGRPRHWRRVTVQDGGPLTITDRVVGDGHHEARGGLLLAPGWEARPEPGGWVVRKGRKKVLVEVRGPMDPKRSVERRRYHPQFGLEVEVSRLCWSVQSALPIAVHTVMERG